MKYKSSNFPSIALFFLILSVFSGLILSVWALINKASGKRYVIQLVFGLLCIVLFGYVSYHFYMEGPGAGNQMIWYYLGMIGTYSNGLTALIWILTLFVKANNP
jgi:hypothetical protein